MVFTTANNSTITSIMALIQSIRTRHKPKLYSCCIKIGPTVSEIHRLKTFTTKRDNIAIDLGSLLGTDE